MQMALTLCVCGCAVFCLGFFTPMDRSEGMTAARLVAFLWVSAVLLMLAALVQTAVR